MTTRWRAETGKLTCRWDGVEKHSEYDSTWMRDNAEVRGSYLAPVPDFASHSPFGGPDWFEFHLRTQSCGPSE
jgi:hypothetical protein